jgi:cyclin-dependent kinase 12/13
MMNLLQEMSQKGAHALLILLTYAYFSFLQKRRLVSHANAKSKSEKFPPPHQDGAVGFPLGSSNQMDPLYEPPDPTSFSTVFAHEKSSVPTWSGPLVNSSAVGNQKRKHKSRSSKQPATARAR